MTANAMTQHREASLAAGADLHLAKPVTAEAVIGAIQQVLSAGTQAANDAA
jgi:CheY-like chemotaxis protein